MPYTVYILFSPAHDRYYIGQTQDMAERISRHNEGYEKATSPFAPWIIVGTIPKTTRTEAMLLERKIKNLKRERLQQFIAKYCQ